MADVRLFDLQFSEMCGDKRSTSESRGDADLVSSRADVTLGRADVSRSHGDDGLRAPVVGVQPLGVKTVVNVTEANMAYASVVDSGNAPHTSPVHSSHALNVDPHATNGGGPHTSPLSSSHTSTSHTLHGSNVNNIAKQSDRVSVWDRLGTKMVDGSKSFSSIVGSVPQPELEFFPVEKNEKLRVLIPKEVTKGMAEPFKCVLYGYFLGPRIPFPLVQRAVQNAWGKFGYKDAMMNAHGAFFFRFHNEGGCAQVVESSPLMIRGVPLFVYPWDPSKGLRRPEHTTCPLWIKFHNIPLVVFNREGISRIASAVGVPLRMDACTAATCDKAWGRTNFAKVLVNVWATGVLQREIEVVIPHLQDNGEDVVKVVLEYDWEPSQCSVCKVFGHKQSSCVKAVANQVKEASRVWKDADGFQKPNRKQWRPKSNPVPNSKAHGDTSRVDKGKETTDADTMVGVGKVTRNSPKGTKDGNIPTVLSRDQLVGNKGQGVPVVATGTAEDGGRTTTVDHDVAKGEYCTLNAGRTPGTTIGLTEISEGGSQEGNVRVDGGVISTGGAPASEPVQGRVIPGPSLLESVVQSFKQYERARRGNPIPETPLSNRFQSLSSDDDSDDEEVENIDMENVTVVEAEGGQSQCQ